MIDTLVKALLEDIEIKKDIEYALRKMIKNSIIELCERDFAYNIQKRVEGEAMERLEPLIVDLVGEEARHIKNLMKERRE